MIQYLQLYISALLFNAGGHSLYEFTAPFILEQIKSFFRNEFKFEGVTLESMFLRGNEQAFDQALEDTIAYNQSILLRQTLCSNIIQFHEELRQIRLFEFLLNVTAQKPRSVQTRSLNSSSLGEIKLDMIKKCCKMTLKQIRKGDLFDALLMIATFKKELRRTPGEPTSINMIESVEKQLNEAIASRPLWFETPFKKLDLNLSTVGNK